MMKLTRQLWRMLLRHLRVGYVSGLILFDAIAVVLLGIDLNRYLAMGRSFSAAIAVLPSKASSDSLAHAALMFVSLALVIPIAVAVVLSFIGTSRGSTRIASGKGQGVLALVHIAFAGILSVSSILFDSMQVVSGNQLNKTLLGYSFVPYFQPSLTYLTLLPYAALPIEILLAFILSLAHKAAEGRRIDILYDYSTRLLLADLRGELYPLAGRHSLNFNTAAISPEIRYTKERTNELVNNYQACVPGSVDAENHLLAAYKEVSTLLKKLLLKPEEIEDVHLELLPGTSRALEVSLTRIRNLKSVILSPFEHPVERKVAEWSAFANGAKLYQVSFEANDYLLEWSLQRDKVLLALKALPLPQDGNNVLVLSQVCYATGRVIPIKDLTQAIRASLDTERLSIIVDAAHYVGNSARVNALNVAKSYVFSTHKWLLSPEPHGVILSHEDEPQPYDAWRESLPSTTSSVRAIMGLWASLELIERVGFESLWTRSKKLRNYFQKRIDTKFQIVGTKSELRETLMLTIRPKAGFVWRYPDVGSLREYLQGRSASVLVLSVDPATPWIRISFPYFLELHQVRSLQSILEAAIIPESQILL